MCGNCLHNGSLVRPNQRMYSNKIKERESLGPVAAPTRPILDDTFHSRQPETMFPSPNRCKKLIINYLPQSYTEKDILEMLVVFGAVESVKVIRDKKTGRSHEYGFATFKDDRDAFDAIRALNGAHIEEKRIKVSYARPASKDLHQTKLYITNLALGTTEKELEEMFGNFGNIVQKNLLYNSTTGISCGTAFVRFDNRDQAADAIQRMNKRIPHGAIQPICVKLAYDHVRKNENT